MIRVRGMEKSYRTGKLVNKVLHGVDLEVSDGEFVAIVGPSGSGKSTLLHALGGLDRDYTGLVEIDGKDLHKLSDVELSNYRNRDVGFVFQAFNLLAHLTCRENVALPAQFSRGETTATAAESSKRAQAMLERVGLADKVDAQPNTLSGGQKQRVAIARALFNTPRMMLCDEPTGNLDSKTGEQILDLFRELNDKDGITVLIVTHDPRISELAGRTVRVEDGHLYEGADDEDTVQDASGTEADDSKDTNA
ncbi:MAG: ABC transporter ATP-binding protein [Nannocystaceae bacterium]|nr:ABC transporter ATP-binding protein [Nannocystaceae bacterium]